MDRLSDASIDAALERGRVARSSEPRARSVRFDPVLGEIVVRLTNGCSFSFPARLGQGLEAASDEALAGVVLSGAGYGLNWAALDVDLSIPGLLSGIFGTAAHMARLAGRATSDAKAAASRANGAKGGRPRRVAAV